MTIHSRALFAMQGRNVDFAMQVWCPLQDVDAGDEAIQLICIPGSTYGLMNPPSNKQHLLQAMARSIFSLLTAKLVKRLYSRQAVWCGCCIFCFDIILTVGFASNQTCCSVC